MAEAGKITRINGLIYPVSTSVFRTDYKAFKTGGLYLSHWHESSGGQSCTPTWLFIRHYFLGPKNGILDTWPQANFGFPEKSCPWDPIVVCREQSDSGEWMRNRALSVCQLWKLSMLCTVIVLTTFLLYCSIDSHTEARSSSRKAVDLMVDWLGRPLSLGQYYILLHKNKHQKGCNRLWIFIAPLVRRQCELPGTAR